MSEFRAKKIEKELKKVDESKLVGEELIDYLEKKIKLKRPEYSREFIINLMTCITQGFLTVFSGPPGCGKTSICEIISDSLGMNNYGEITDEGDERISRFVPISVERGWVGKEDFIGYYSPLTKEFETKNKELFDCFEVLNLEAREKIKQFPYIVMLDEANLSPMEYYWASFIRACDDNESDYKIDFGGKTSFIIPNHLRFLATINNDHTTEMLSPRLIDRSWVISLPKVKGPSLINEKINDNNMSEHITWNSLVNTFGISEEECVLLPVKFQEIKNEFERMNVFISPRVEKSIIRYYSSAIRWMDEDVAVDYAILQKILPFISGTGENYEKVIKDICVITEDYDLLLTSEKIKEICYKATKNMNIYQFFS